MIVCRGGYFAVHAILVAGGFLMYAFLNFLYFIFFGLWSTLLWLLLAGLFAITIVGLPIAKQCLKFTHMSAFPYGKKIVKTGGAVSTALNVLWVILVGWWVALIYISAMVGYAVTIIGLPVAYANFKMVMLCLCPFGKEIMTDEQEREYYSRQNNS